MGNFEGILFTLKKRMQNIEEDDSRYYKYLVMGHYDGLAIDAVDTWYDYRPAGLRKRGHQVDLGQSFIDQYTIRAVVPRNRVILERQGFDYQYWERIGRIETDKFGETVDMDRAKKPYICMSLIKLTENFIKENYGLPRLLDAIISIVKKGVRAQGNSLSELHCAIFPSIGYSDFIILFQTDDLSKAAGVISSLRTERSKNGTLGVSDCYSVCGVDKHYIEDKNSFISTETQMSIRINLKAGVSATKFLKILQNEILERAVNNAEDDLYEKQMQEFALRLEDNFQVMFGRTDCLLLFHQPLDCYMKLYAQGNILNPSAPFFQNNISSLRASISVPGKVFTSDPGTVPYPSKDLQVQKTRFQDFMHEYEAFLEEHDIQIRSAKGLQQIMVSFLNIAQMPHGFDAEALLGPAIISLIDCVSYYFRKTVQKVPEDASNDETEQIIEENKKIEDSQYLAVQGILEFRDIIGTFAVDLARSDRLFIEGNILNHAAIGSATKLLFLYNSILENLNRQFKVEDRFSFVVNSGGSDCASATDFFSFAAADDPIKKPVVITIPEMGLYDIQGTLFRTLHEYLHFVGDRRRRERYLFIITALAGMMADGIAETEYDEDRLAAFQEQAVGRLKGKLKTVLENRISALFSKTKEEVKNGILNAFLSENFLYKAYYGEHTKESDYYSKELKSGVLNLYSFAHAVQIRAGNPGTDNLDAGNFDAGSADRDIGKDNIQRTIYKVLHEADISLTCSIREVIWKLLEDSSVRKTKTETNILSTSLRSYDVMMQDYEFIDKQRGNSDVDQRTAGFVQNCFDTLMSNYTLGDIRNAVRSEKADIYPSLLYDYNDILGMIFLPMNECFSDCCSCCILDMKAEDFLLSFIYEQWRIDQALPLTINNCLRIGADLEILFEIRGSLPEKVKSAVRGKASKREKQGYQYRNVDEMLERIDHLLASYQVPDYRPVGRELENYLRLCVGDREQWFSKELHTLYQKCDFYRPADIYFAVDEIFAHWSSLGGSST